MAQFSVFYFSLIVYIYLATVKCAASGSCHIAVPQGPGSCKPRTSPRPCGFAAGNALPSTHFVQTRRSSRSGRTLTCGRPKPRSGSSIGTGHLQRLKIIVLYILLILYTIYDIDIHCDLVDPQMEAPHDQSFHRERLAGPAGSPCRRRLAALGGRVLVGRTRGGLNRSHRAGGKSKKATTRRSRVHRARRARSLLRVLRWAS
jgi:hypothetical protein